MRRGQARRTGAARAALLTLALLSAVGCGTEGGPGDADTGPGATLDAAAAADGSPADILTGDTRDADTFAGDGATPDAENPDTGSADAGSPDTLAKDTSDTDLDPGDIATPDTGTPDTGAPDTGAPDTGAPDTPDATDAAAADVADAAKDVSADTSQPDAALPDAATGDTSDAGDAAGTSDAGAPWPPWPADAWAGPVKPTDPSALPKAAFTEVSQSYGFSDKQGWAFCAAVGQIDGDGQPDAVFIELKGGGFGVPTGTVQALLLGGAKPKLVASPFDTTLLFPDGGCALADLDGDGFGDLVVGGSSGLALYAGDGKGGFKDVSAKRLPATLTAQVWSVAIDDLDGDGDLDLFLGSGGHPDTCQGVTCKHGGVDFACTYDQAQPAKSANDDRVLLQQPGGTFVDATAAWNVPKGGILTSVASYDLDGDGFPEVLVGNDFGWHGVLPNLKGKGFGKPVSAGFTSYAHAMGWGIGDVNGDGGIDLVLADLGPVNLYYGKPGGGIGPWQALPPGHPSAGVTWQTSSWVPHLVDLDNDGDLDLYLGVSMAVNDIGKDLMVCAGNTASYAANDLVFVNQGSGQWQARSVAKPTCGRVAAIAQSMVDFDGDGDLDVVQIRPGCVGMTGRIRLLRNDLPNKGGAAQVRLVGPPGNRDAIGAVVRVQVGAQTHERRIVGGVGVGSSGQRRIHVGLGQAKMSGAVKVRWPGATTWASKPALKAGATVSWSAP